MQELAARLTTLSENVKQLESERDEYKRVYVALLEAYRKLEAGLVGQKRERFIGGEEQLTLAELLKLVVPVAAQPAPTTEVPAHERAKPTGRKPPQRKRSQ